MQHLIDGDSNQPVHHEYILVFAKNKNLWKPNKTQRTEDHNQYYKNPDNDNRGPWNSAAYTCNKSKSERRNLYYAIVNPNTGEEIYPDENAVWAYSRETHLSHVSEKLLYWGADGKSKSPRKKQFLIDAQPVVPRSVWDYQEVGSTQTATTETRQLFDGASFSYPKSVGLLKKAIYQATAPSDIILDFFSGSATTAHATLELNKQDNGNRKFIMVQLPEPCAEDSEAFKAGYKTIAEIGKERIRRVIKKLNGEEDGKLDLDQSVIQDRGFKVLKLDKSNFKRWQKIEPSTPPEQIVEQLELHIDHISPKATSEDLLYEILLKAGFTPTEKIETKIIASKKVFSVADGALLLCLEDDVTKELIDSVAEAEPMQFICLDSAFHGNDQLKANAVQTFAARNMQKEKHNQIVFKTV